MTGTKRVQLDRGEHELPETIVVSELSELSQDVMRTFGIEAPALLNRYACSVEDSFIELVDRVKDLRLEVEVLTEANEQLKQQLKKAQATAPAA